MKYTEFVKANYDKVSNLPAKQRMAKLGQMWRDATDEEKEPFVEQAAEAKAEYEKASHGDQFLEHYLSANPVGPAIRH
jgi:hypothetical protein